MKSNKPIFSAAQRLINRLKPLHEMRRCGGGASVSGPIRDKTPTPSKSLIVGILAILLVCGCDGEMVLHGEPGQFEYPTAGTTDENPSTTADDESAGPNASASLHRLNRLEYNNSVRELLGTTLTPADQFPPDASVGGFDNVASALSITPALMDQYLEAAREVIDDAFADRPAFEARLEEDDPSVTYTVDRASNSIGGIMRLRNGSGSSTIEIPRAAAYTLEVRSQGVVNGTAAAPRLRVTVGERNFDFDAPQTMQTMTFALDLPAGNVPVSFQSLNFEEDAPANTGNDILFDYLVLRSDEVVEGPARQRVLICEPSTDECVASIINTFGRRAWRRPLTRTEQTKLGSLYLSVREAGESVEESIKLTLRAILTSPKFLYRYRTVEDSDSETLLDPYVLASRMSYFIWSSTPSDRLLGAAEDGTLTSPTGVRETVRWMLEDPRSKALADGFAEQWLDLRHIEQASPNPQVYPTFNEGVRQSMIRESKLFFLDFVENDQPVANMLQPDFAYRDANLANHLGVPGPTADGFERMPVSPGDRRGVLSLSAWLTARSDTEHSSPIRRGSWIADNMLCTPVPPPPPGLEIGELAEEESGMTLRERLEQHRSNPSCAGCHARLDVLGMGFETFDATGRWIEDPTLDSTGELPGGVEFRGANEMAAALDDTTFVTCVSRKLFTYALGQPPTTADLDSLAVERTAMTMTLPDLVTAIVLSPAFSQPRPLE